MLCFTRLCHAARIMHKPIAFILNTCWFIDLFEIAKILFKRNIFQVKLNFCHGWFKRHRKVIKVLNWQTLYCYSLFSKVKLYSASCSNARTTYSLRNEKQIYWNGHFVFDRLNATEYNLETHCISTALYMAYLAVKLKNLFRNKPIEIEHNLFGSLVFSSLQFLVLWGNISALSFLYIWCSRLGARTQTRIERHLVFDPISKLCFRINKMLKLGIDEKRSFYIIEPTLPNLTHQWQLKPML